MKERKRVQKHFFEPSRTKQSFKAECDINHIMKRFKKVAGVDIMERFQGYAGGTYGDFSEVTDYRTAIEQVNRANETFMALPAKVRARFSNDPAEFLDFVQNPVNSKEMVELGLASKPVEQNGIPQTGLGK